ncbi:unnamed protein product [Oreochromis niloticus]|nr:unnamed protein product [Mustela putorius furo]
MPLPQLNSNICQLCIQPEALACCAQALGRDFRPLLTTWLYPVLEKAGEETLLVSQAALSSIWNINKVCGYASLKELINENSDYLLNDISLNLQRLSLHLQAPPVLTVLLTHSDCSLLVGDMVQDLDLSYERTAALFLRVEICRGTAGPCTSPFSKMNKCRGDGSFITKDAMERCIHLLSDPSLRLRLKVLDVLELCVQVLSERENELLPMAHRCWPALLQTLTADDPLAVLRAFRLKQT